MSLLDSSSSPTARKKRERHVDAEGVDLDSSPCALLKQCRNCDVWKERDQFNRHSPASEKLRNDCKECQSAYQKRLRLSRVVPREIVPLPRLKTCIHCGVSKERCNFYAAPRCADGLQGACKACMDQDRIANSETLRGALLILLKQARTQAKRLAKKGSEAGSCSLTYEQLLEISISQNHASGLFLTKTLSLVRHTSWRISLARRNRDLGWSKGNCWLVAQELNMRIGWTPDMVREMLLLRGEPDPDVASMVASIQHRDPVVWPVTIIKKAGRGPPHASEGEEDGSCKECVADYQQTHGKTPFGFVRRLLGGTPQTCNRRGMPRAKLTRDEFCNQLQAQKARCFISSVPVLLCPGSPWSASLERLDNKGTYTPDNIVIICAQFNSSCNRGGRDTTGQEVAVDSQWNPGKFQEWLAYLEQHPPSPAEPSA